MKSTWRFFLGAAIGLGLGYAAVLLRPQPRRGSHLRTIYRAPEPKAEKTRTAA